MYLLANCCWITEFTRLPVFCSTDGRLLDVSSCSSCCNWCPPKKTGEQGSAWQLHLCVPVNRCVRTLCLTPLSRPRLLSGCLPRSLCGGLHGRIQSSCICMDVHLHENNEDVPCKSRESRTTVYGKPWQTVNKLAFTVYTLTRISGCGRSCCTESDTDAF